MEVNGLTKYGMPASCLGCGPCAERSSAMVAPPSPTSTLMKGARGMMMLAGNKRQHSKHFYCSNHCMQRRCGANDFMKRVLDNVSQAKAKVQHIQDLMANHAQHHYFGSLQEQLFTEKVQLIDALVMMGWEHYRCFLVDNHSFDSATAAVRHIYEEALDISVQLFNMSPGNFVNNDRLMVLLLILDFDEYCEALLQYQLARENMKPANAADAAAGVSRAETADLRLAELLKTVHGSNCLQQIFEMWTNGQFEKCSEINRRDEDEDIAKVNATGLCLTLFRKLESSQVDQRTMGRQFKYLFDEYLPRQLSQPSMTNMIVTKYARVLFQQDGSPTVYWSLMADEYRKEWSHCFEEDDVTDCGYESADMDTDDEDDGL